MSQSIRNLGEKLRDTGKARGHPLLPRALNFLSSILDKMELPPRSQILRRPWSRELKTHNLIQSLIQVRVAKSDTLRQKKSPSWARLSASSRHLS